MSDYPALINRERASNLVAAIQDAKSRSDIGILVDEVERFFLEQPSQLQSPFDLAFFVEVLKDRIELVRNTISGAVPAMGCLDEEDYLRTSPVLDPASDRHDSGIRRSQAGNYVAVCSDRKLQGTMLTLTNGVFVRQRSKGRLMTGESVRPIHPDYPFDYLFMVMAVDYALRTGTAARLKLEGGEGPE